MEKKSSTKDFDKGTSELVYMKQAVTILRKGLDKYDGRSKGYKGWFKLDSGFLKTTFSTIHSELYKELFEKNDEDQDTEIYKTFIESFNKESIKKNMEKRTKNDYSIRGTSTRRNRSAQTSKISIYFVSSNRKNRFNMRNKIKCNNIKTHSKEEYIYIIPSFVYIKKGSNSKSR